MKAPRTPSIWMRGAPNTEMIVVDKMETRQSAIAVASQGTSLVGCRNEPAEGSRKQMAAGNGRQPLPWGNQRL